MSEILWKFNKCLKINNFSIKTNFYPFQLQKKFYFKLFLNENLFKMYCIPPFLNKENTEHKRQYVTLPYWINSMCYGSCQTELEHLVCHLSI